MANIADILVIIGMIASIATSIIVYIMFLLHYIGKFNNFYYGNYN